MIVTLALWFTLGVFIGLLVFFTAGFMTLPLGVEYQHKAASYYSKLAQKLIGRSAIMERGTKWDLIDVSADPEKNADTFEIGDETAHVTNETGLLARWFKQPFGLLAPPEEDISVYLSPEIGEFGAVEVERREQGDLFGESGAYDEHVTLSDSRPLVRLREYARAMIPGSRSYFDLSEAVEIYKQSQTGFADSRTTQLMILVIAYVAGAGVTWLVVTQAGGVGDAISLPMALGVGL